MAEKTDLKEFARGYVTPASWWKSFGVVSKFLILAALGWAIWIAFIKPWVNPVKTQEQHTTIEVKPGGTLNLTQQQKQEAPKKRWIVFVEPYLSQGSKQKMETGIRVGVRREW
jgi:hypothetical protein